MNNVTEYAKQDNMDAWKSTPVGENLLIGVRPVGSAYGERIGSKNWVVSVMAKGGYCLWSRIVAAGPVEWPLEACVGGLSADQADRAQAYFDSMSA